MTIDARPRIRLPATARPGEAFQIRTLLSHPMEGGQRRDGAGARIPRRIVNRFTCTFEGETVVDLALDPGVSANPFFEFDARVDRSGTFEFRWIDDDGSVYADSRTIEVG